MYRYGLRYGRDRHESSYCFFLARLERTKFPAALNVSHHATYGQQAKRRSNALRGDSRDTLHS